VTGTSRAAERAARRKRRRDNIRLIIAGFCVTAGVLLFVSVKLDGDQSAAAPAAHGHPSTSSTRHPSPSSSSHSGAPTPLPIYSTPGQTNSSGPAAFSNPDLVATVMAAAKTGVETVDSYDYRDLNAAIAAGLAATTGQFQASYRSAMTGSVATAAPDSMTVQHCVVENVGVTSVSDDLSRASVLVFGRLQITDSTTGPTPRVTKITLGVTLDAVGGSWLISAVNDFSTTTAKSQPPGTRALFDAAVAGAQEVVNLLSFSRADYDSDFGRALSGLTGPLLTEQQGQREVIRAKLARSNVDYVGEIRGIGIESVSPDSVILLVAATSAAVDDAGVKSVQELPKIEIGVVRINGTWLVNQFQVIAPD